jgi:hypothetical protein
MQHSFTVDAEIANVHVLLPTEIVDKNWVTADLEIIIVTQFYDWRWNH